MDVRTQRRPRNSYRQAPTARRRQAGRNELWISIIFLFALLAAGALALLTPKESSDYAQAQGTFFVGCILAILSTFALMRLHKNFWDEFVRVATRSATVTDGERANALWLVGFILGLIGLLVVDMSFFQNNGLRLTVVIGSAVGRAVWAIFRGR